MKHYLLIMGICTSFVLHISCGEEKEPTEMEKGKEYAKDKLDYAEGAAEVLNEKGEPVGRTTGKGVGGLLKGIGSGIMDAVYPPVKIKPSQELMAAGITVNKAEEGSSTRDGSEVNLTLAFSKIYKGRLRLHAFDAKGVEMGRAVSNTINQPVDSILDLTVHFDKRIRMSNVSYCEAHLIAPKTVSLMGDAAPPPEGEEGIGIELGQMHEGDGTPLKVTQYVIFNQKFFGELQMRAYDATGSEIGRSQKFENLDQDADSSNTFEFTFHETVTVDSAARYSLYAAKSKGKKKKK